MKNSESIQEFKKLNSSQINEKIDQLSKDLFDLRFKQATRQLNETHQFRIIKKQIAQLLTISKSKSTSTKTAD
ncbi:MAG: 50S ribosomal protein L29 [Prochlorococcus sp. SP3034]|nr:50S ribosomal protein L29 [Prochlorococcus sp. SP3034]|tara:strand:- start:567 stop:785 length:219 start_codon:yes stop_codon:yes gene_type:complete